MKLHCLPLVLLLALPGTATAVDPATPESASGSATAAVVAQVPAASAAPVALLVDLSSGQTLFARQADARMLPASMTKAMTALVAFDLIAAGKLSEAAAITVRPETAQRWSGRGTTLSLRSGERVAVSDLLRAVTIVSANDAAVALAQGALGSEAAFVAEMNARAKALGMTGSRFASVNGYPDGGQTYVTARDMVRLGEALIAEHPELYARYFGHKTMLWHRQQLSSHNPFADGFPGADGIKTGFSSQAGYTFLGAVERDGRRLVLVIGQAPSEAARAKAAMDLAEWGYGTWRSRPFLPAGWVAGTARVQDGAARRVPLRLARGYSLALPAGSNPAVAARIVYSGPLRAPVAEGAQVASLELRIAGQVSHSLPLLAAQEVAQADAFDRVINGVLGLLE